MTVEELIEELRKLDPKLRVVRPGYEGGLEEIDCVSPIEMFLNVNTEWYYGPHEMYYELNKDVLEEKNYEKVNAIYLK